MLAWSIALFLYGLLFGSAAHGLGAQFGDNEAIDEIIAGRVGRLRWVLSHLMFAMLGPAVALFGAGVAVALTYGAAIGDIAGTAPGALAGALVQLPAVWICVGITMVLFGWLPRFTPAAWAVYVMFLLIFSIGSLAELPQWALDAEPFGHLPKLLGATFTPVPVLGEILLAVVLIVVGAIGFRRRDLT